MKKISQTYKKQPNQVENSFLLVWINNYDWQNNMEIPRTQQYDEWVQTVNQTVKAFTQPKLPFIPSQCTWVPLLDTDMHTIHMHLYENQFHQYFRTSIFRGFVKFTVSRIQKLRENCLKRFDFILVTVNTFYLT